MQQYTSCTVLSWQCKNKLTPAPLSICSQWQGIGSTAVLRVWPHQPSDLCGQLEGLSPLFCATEEQGFSDLWFCFSTLWNKRQWKLQPDPKVSDSTLFSLALAVLMRIWCYQSISLSFHSTPQSQFLRPSLTRGYSIAPCFVVCCLPPPPFIWDSWLIL